MGVESVMYSKLAVINPSKVDIRFHIGAHACDPRGEVVCGGTLSLLHCDGMGAKWIIDRWATARTRATPGWWK